MQLNRRHFNLSLASGLFATAMPGLAQAQEGATRTVTTALGTYDIPAAPQRVVAIDSRMDLEPAVAIGLPLLGYHYAQAEPWVPVDAGVEFLARTPNREQLLTLQPDLIICLNQPDGGGELWPLEQLRPIAPILPIDNAISWKQNLENIAEWVGRRGEMDSAMARYQTTIEQITTRHAKTIDTALVAAVQFWEKDSRFAVRINHPEKPNMMQTQVLGDLGGRTLTVEDTGDYEISPENLGTVLANVDAIMLVNPGEGELAALAQHEIWNRIPAVSSGRVAPIKGNTNYGSIYTATYVAEAWDSVYALLA